MTPATDRDRPTSNRTDVSALRAELEQELAAAVIRLGPLAATERNPHRLLAIVRAEIKTPVDRYVAGAGGAVRDGESA